MERPERPAGTVRLLAAPVGHAGTVGQVAGLERAVPGLDPLEEREDRPGVAGVPRAGEGDRGERCVTRPDVAPRPGPAGHARAVRQQQRVEVEQGGPRRPDGGTARRRTAAIPRPASRAAAGRGLRGRCGRRRAFPRTRRWPRTPRPGLGRPPRRSRRRRTAGGPRTFRERCSWTTPTTASRASAVASTALRHQGATGAHRTRRTGTTADLPPRTRVARGPPPPRRASDPWRAAHATPGAQPRGGPQRQADKGGEQVADIGEAASDGQEGHQPREQAAARARRPRGVGARSASTPASPASP